MCNPSNGFLYFFRTWGSILRPLGPPSRLLFRPPKSTRFLTWFLPQQWSIFRAQGRKKANLGSTFLCKWLSGRLCLCYLDMLFVVNHNNGLTHASASKSEWPCGVNISTFETPLTQKRYLFANIGGGPASSFACGGLLWGHLVHILAQLGAPTIRVFTLLLFLLCIISYYPSSWTIHKPYPVVPFFLSVFWSQFVGLCLYDTACVY